MTPKTLFIPSSGGLSIFSARSLESSCCGREGNVIETKLVQQNIQAIPQTFAFHNEDATVTQS